MATIRPSAISSPMRSSMLRTGASAWLDGWSNTTNQPSFDTGRAAVRTALPSASLPEVGDRPEVSSAATCGSALVDGRFSGSIEVLGDGASPTPGFKGVSVAASALNAIAAPRLGIGGLPSVTYVDYTGSSQRANIAGFNYAAGSIVLREGAVLKAGEVYLVTN
eukprot:gene13509-17940_t